MHNLKYFVLFALMLIALQGCVASRTEVMGKFNQPRSSNPEPNKVSVLFHFRHISQQHGWDSIPKLKAQGVADFNNIFRDSLVEITNVSRYDTFTESPADVDSPKRREELNSYKLSDDYTIALDFYEESSFQQQCFSGIISLASLTVIPMPYTWDYTITAKVTDKNGRSCGTYERKASLSQWTQALLLFAYPFYPYEGKREEIYSEALRDIFRQIESERVLKKL